MKCCVYAPKFYTLQWLMVTAETELLLNMVWCFVVYCVQLPACWIFCLPWLFQSFCLSQSIQSRTSSILLVSLESRSWSWTSKSWSWSWSWTSESWSRSWSWISKSWSWSWSWISKSWIQVWMLGPSDLDYLSAWNTKAYDLFIFFILGYDCVLIHDRR